MTLSAKSMNTTLFCLDFDETLSNTDRLRAGLTEGVRRIGSEELAAAYLEAYETVRKKHGGVSIPLVLKELKDQISIQPETHYQLAELFHTFPYHDYLYPGAEKVVTHLKQQGKVIIFSDGDAFFQPQKIHATPIAALVDGIVILSNKTDYLNEVAGYWPAVRYVFIDDKQHVLDAAKKHFGKKATTILVRQGRYATTTKASAADLSAASIADVPGLLPVSDTL